MDEAALHAMLREYLEGDARKENRELRRDLSTLAERIARLEALQGVQQQELTDTQRLRLPPPGWAPPSAPPRKNSHSAFPRIVAHLLDPKVLVLIGGLIGWLSHHFVK